MDLDALNIVRIQALTLINSFISNFHMLKETYFAFSDKNTAYITRYVVNSGCAHSKETSMMSLFSFEGKELNGHVCHIEYQVQKDMLSVSTLFKELLAVFQNFESKLTQCIAANDNSTRRKGNYPMFWYKKNIDGCYTNETKQFHCSPGFIDNSGGSVI